MKLDGVKDATVSYEKRSADVAYDGAKLKPEDFVKALESAGFTAKVETEKERGEGR